jgi:hypothetical protein
VCAELHQGNRTRVVQQSCVWRPCMPHRQDILKLVCTLRALPKTLKHVSPTAFGHCSTCVVAVTATSSRLGDWPASKGCQQDCPTLVVWVWRTSIVLHHKLDVTVSRCAHCTWPKSAAVIITGCELTVKQDSGASCVSITRHANAAAKETPSLRRLGHRLSCSYQCAPA